MDVRLETGFRFSSSFFICLCICRGRSFVGNTNSIATLVIRPYSSI